MGELTPLRLRPCYKEYLWGGERLKKEYGKTNAPEVTAESWELAAHPDGMSAVVGGALDGKTLPEHGEQGKTEMWYIVDCEPQASIYFGFSRRVTRDEFLRRAEDGSICEVLNRMPVRKGDVFYILPGTIHAVGAGIVIAEIQHNSNTTFRVYDYRRRDASGNLRPLHLERAAEVLNYDPLIPSECKANGMTMLPGFRMTEMFSCRYFRAYKLDIETEARLYCDGTSFHHLLCVEGEAVITADGKDYPVRRGESYFIPAAMGEYQVRGASRVLLSRV